MDDRPQLFQIVIDEPGDGIRQLLVAPDLACHAFPATPGTVDQNPLGSVADLAEDHLSDRLIIGERQQDPRSDPGKPDQEKPHDPVDDENGSGDVQLGGEQQKAHLENG